MDGCISGGLYCAFPNLSINLTDPILILKENLKQKCIYNVVKEKKNNKIFFEYMSTFFQTCLNGTGLIKNFHRVCSDAVMEHLKIPTENITECIRNSFDNYEKYRLSENQIYKKNNQDVLKYKFRSSSTYPSIVINNIPFKVIICLIRDYKMEKTFLRQFVQDLILFLKFVLKNFILRKKINRLAYG